MIVSPAVSSRPLRTVSLSADLVIVGGGIAGICAALTAARQGLRVILVQDRPVLGGNASSEVRLWILGATSHMGSNNRWAREGGVIDEILLENLFRNPEGNPLLLDALLLDKVKAESNLTLLLNTAVCEATKGQDDTVSRVRGFCAQNSTIYDLDAPLFCDASGDGVVGFLAGAAFRTGAEARAEFGEGLAPENENRELLGHSLYFYSKDTGRPVTFVPPQFALRDVKQIPRWRDFKAGEHGCKLWWIEHGGLLDTVHETERIKWELWQIVYGVWNHIKNSGRFPEAANLTLEWVGTIPGKRESRRFEGDYLLRQQDIIAQRSHADAVAFGGWAVDLHPPEGIFSAKDPCTQWHAKGPYQIPFRCLYSRNIPNLFLAGRIISATHVAFGSTRVMATCAHVGQAVGMAASLCRRRNLLPRELAAAPNMGDLQRMLLRSGQHIPGLQLHDPEDLGRQASFTASSELALAEFKPDGPWVSLREARAMLVPVRAGDVMAFTIETSATADREIRVELRQSSRNTHHTPDVILATKRIQVSAGFSGDLAVEFEHRFAEARYTFICFFADETVRLRATSQRVSGVLSLCHARDAAVAKSAVQSPPANSGIDTFEFWRPQRRPAGHNLALRFRSPLKAFGVGNLRHGVARPTDQPNAWVAAFDDSRPTLTLRWDHPQTIRQIELMFDGDYDHPLESVLMTHPERRVPFCIERFRLLDDSDAVLWACTENHQARCVISLSSPCTTTVLKLEVEATAPDIPAAVFALRCYGANNS